MMYMVRDMREGIFDDLYDDYITTFINDHFIESKNGGADAPQ